MKQIKVTNSPMRNADNNNNEFRLIFVDGKHFMSSTKYELVKFGVWLIWRAFWPQQYTKEDIK